jgi:DNA-directed RNA polymerase subunit RPC12/RpoP
MNVARDLAELERRVRAIERVFGLPRYVTVRECGQCGADVIELRASRMRKTDACPDCGSRALYRQRRVPWPLGREP